MKAPSLRARSTAVTAAEVLKMQNDILRRLAPKNGHYGRMQAGTLKCAQSADGNGVDLLEDEVTVTARRPSLRLTDLSISAATSPSISAQRDEHSGVAARPQGADEVKRDGTEQSV